MTYNVNVLFIYIALMLTRKKSQNSVPSVVEKYLNQSN